LKTIVGDGSSRPKPIILPKPVAPFDRNPVTAAQACFDRDTGIVIPIDVLKTYKDALTQYHLRPEHKFLNSNYMDRGTTKRRRVKPIAVRNIGKEANRWEEKFYLGSEESAEINYGLAPQDSKAFLDKLRARIIVVGQREISRRTGISRRTISRFLEGKEARKQIIIILINAVQAA
jgi:hypothetical protein